MNSPRRSERLMVNSALRSGNTTSALKGTISFQGLGSRVFGFLIEKEKKKDFSLLVVSAPDCNMSVAIPCYIS